LTRVDAHNVIGILLYVLKIAYIVKLCQVKINRCKGEIEMSYFGGFRNVLSGHFC
jgi:hypothetical protein